ncbi:type II secretion system protein [Metabacillus fastidiosus]|uniref:type II secretion system protein n=1 Tax=Metabacillus fastidiosus TaxID=1458 RepID=UPI003D27EB35
MMKKLVKNQRGLTLIELLAVIVILGIIAAIAVPAVNAIMNKSKEDALVLEARNVVNAAKMYVASKKPEENKTFRETDAKDEGLGEYLDNPPQSYTITVNYNNGDYEYSTVTVKKNGKQETYNAESFEEESPTPTPPASGGEQ